MITLGEAIERLQVRRGVEKPDPSSPEEIERWLIDRQLWPTARIAADLEAVRDEHNWRVDEISRRHAAASIARLERDLELAQLRDRLEAERPEGCWCFGIGGHGRVAVPTGDDEPLLSWRVWCSCEDARRLRAEVEQRRNEIQRARRQATLDRLWGSLPAKYRDWSLATLRGCSAEHGRLADQVEAWLDDSQRWLFLYGPVGRGKTGAAVGALKFLAEQGRTALFAESTDLLDHLRSSYSDHQTFAESRDVLWESLYGVDVLLLDDLGSERHRSTETVDWATEKLWQLIGFRHRQERRMLITSNLDLDELRRHLGHARIPSRIEEVALVLDCSRLPNLRVSQ